MNVKNYIPNAITMLNLLSGMVAIVMTMNGNFTGAGLAIFAAALFDFFDGAFARMLKVYSEMGKQLDSLADVVSFGAAPGLLIYKMLDINCAGSCNILEQMHITPWFAMLIPVCSALRLAKFNIDLRQEVNFIGLPTPANALFFASIPLVLWLQPDLFSLIKIHLLHDFFSNTRVVAMLAVVFSYLLISDFRIFSMKFKHFSWEGNQLRYTLVILSVILLILFSLSALPLIIISYVLLSIFFQHMITE